AYLGSVNIVLLLSAVMASLSSLFLVRGEKKKFVVICLMILLAVTIISVRSYSKKKDFDTAYDRYMIVEGKYGSDSRLVRFLTRDYNSSDSAVYLDGDSNLVFDYTKFYRVASHFLAQPKNALMIGGGTFTYPKDFLRKNPDSKITVVEIDPGLLQIAKDYFFYQDDSRQKLVFEDGRTYLNQNQEKYDLLIMDAYKSDTSIPFQLTTRETLMHCYDAMNDNGVIVSNVIGSIRGDRDKFIKAEYRTFASVFPQVKLYAVNDPTDQKLVQNFILVGIKNHTKYDNSDSNFEIAQDLKNEISLPADFGQDVPILTDDYAPVENYVNQL
ncbi:MAG: fused MFS/spermidine synthase, partial [Candidatus Berkelbacteria bacterium]|nr:fused MFS/spermidine synthase [Candidatus Berkelbacteria bacterium]